MSKRARNAGRSRTIHLSLSILGGAASKNGTLRVGDQIISVNGCDVTSMSRIEAWNLMKKLPDGAVSLVIRQQLSPASWSENESRNFLTTRTPGAPVFITATHARHAFLSCTRTTLRGSISSAPSFAPWIFYWFYLYSMTSWRVTVSLFVCFIFSSFLLSSGYLVYHTTLLILYIRRDDRYNYSLLYIALSLVFFGDTRLPFLSRWNIMLNDHRCFSTQR